MTLKMMNRQECGMTARTVGIHLMKLILNTRYAIYASMTLTPPHSKQSLLIAFLMMWDDSMELVPLSKIGDFRNGGGK